MRISPCSTLIQPSGWAAQLRQAVATVSAARRPVHGADRVARFLLRAAERSSPGQRLVALSVNSGPAIGLLDGDQVVAIAVLTLHNRLIRRVDLVLAPDKLTRTHPDVGARQELP